MDFEFWAADTGHYVEVVTVQPEEVPHARWYKVIVDAEPVGVYPSKTAAAYAIADTILDFCY